jgi:YD repeat-containing protein
MDVFNGLAPASGTFTPVNVSDYRERISYDPNGNILSYNRHGDAARLSMDSLSYFYTSNTNRLHKVTDAATDAGANYNLYNDIKQGQTDNNYQYDAIGNMGVDASESITNISWNVYGKITSITKSGAVIRYVYDASGNRTFKYTATDTTAYVRDASGNVMSVYRKPAGGALVQTETHLYGSSRLGMATQHLAPDTTVVLSGGFVNGIKSIFARGEKLFELSNHLQNVLVTISDKKIGVDNNSDGTVDYYTADVITANDYYPFGMAMPSRKYNASGSYESCEKASFKRYREISKINTMKEVEYKTMLFTIMSTLKDLPGNLEEYVNDKEYGKDYTDGMKMAYYNVMENLIRIISDNGISLEEMDMGDYKPIEILYGKKQ